MVTDEQNHSIAMGVALMCLYNGFIGEKSVTHGATPPSVFFCTKFETAARLFRATAPFKRHSFLLTFLLVYLYNTGKKVYRR